MLPQRAQLGFTTLATESGLWRVFSTLAAGQVVQIAQPMSARRELAAIRGVPDSKGTIDVLMEAGWIRPAGRREVPGRPLLYATTPEFLAHFGLASRRDLPGIDDLRAAGLLDPIDLALEHAYENVEVEHTGDDA